MNKLNFLSMKIIQKEEYELEEVNALGVLVLNFIVLGMMFTFLCCIFLLSYCLRLSAQRGQFNSRESINSNEDLLVGRIYVPGNEIIDSIIDGELESRISKTTSGKELPLANTA
eukprot:snap_masked-scaffold_1-processed-gene-8.33-mRNA-1 protein AED:1.00 eAED:1.00 QI:0/-1/0/0/-1/1/1/0/113